MKRIRRCTLTTKVKCRRGIGAGGEDNFWNQKFKFLTVWTCSFEEILMKQLAKNVLRQSKKFEYFLNFLRSERSSALEFWLSRRGWKAAQPKFFDPKSVKFEGSRMLRYGVISDWKMEFLQGVIENFSVVYKNFFYRVWFFENFFRYPDTTCQALALTSKPKIWKN